MALILVEVLVHHQFVVRQLGDIVAGTVFGRTTFASRTRPSIAGDKLKLAWEQQLTSFCDSVLAIERT